MKIKTVTTYIANDGTEFATAKECRAHELRQPLWDLLAVKVDELTTHQCDLVTDAILANWQDIYNLMSSMSGTAQAMPAPSQAPSLQFPPNAR